MFICRAQTCTNDAQTNETNLNQFWHYWGAEWKKWNLNNLKIKRAQMFICRAQTMHKWLRHIWTDSDNIGVLSDVICLQNVMFDISKTEWAQIFICRAQTCTNEAQTIWNSFTCFFYTWGANFTQVHYPRVFSFVCTCVYACVCVCVCVVTTCYAGGRKNITSKQSKLLQKYLLRFGNRESPDPEWRVRTHNDVRDVTGGGH